MEQDMKCKDLESAAVQMAIVANGGDLRGVMAWALGLCCQCVEKMTDKKTATAFCLQMSDLFAEIVGRHEKAHYPEVTMDDIFDASRLDALDADGIEWRALCEIYRETCAPEISKSNGIGVSYHRRGESAMRFEEEEIYLLTVAQAKRHAKRHEEEESWDLWRDEDAQQEATFNRYRYHVEKDEKGKTTMRPYIRKETGRRAS